MYLLIFLIIAALGAGYIMYRVIFYPNVWIEDAEQTSVFIPTSADFDDVKVILYSQGLIINRRNFEWLAHEKKYPELIKPGHYIIRQGMNNNELINMLRAGEQVPVDVIFNNINTKGELAEQIGGQLEFDSTDLIRRLNDSAYLSRYDFDPGNIKTMFIPNTYEFYWTTSPEGFLDRMYSEYKAFWNEERRALADSIDMSIHDVVTLASIVEKETNKKDEKDVIAGVYINRLKKGWLLQADPTLIYAWEDFGIKRVLNVHKEIDSPYNTYKHGGLPPGPICIPSISSIDAVLNYDRNDYLFFCARADLSGYHSFSKSHSQHIRNAREYQEALNKMKIYK
ncbi:MAG: endolytic transglycosylase MltG [Bacteroidota bacterium]|nr:endolytic transglycosylase MltG [Bacteroidota bacterium]